MPDLPGRNNFEKALAAAIGEKLNGALKKLLRYIDPEKPSMEDIPPMFWSSLGEDLTKEIQPKLTAIFVASGHVMADSSAVVVRKAIDWTLVNKAASKWAQDYTFELVKGINETTQKTISDAVTSFFENQGTMGDLRDSLDAAFGPVRAAMIASTEVTRSAVNGELSIVNNIEEDSSIGMQPTFQTSEDELVCDICSPLDGQQVQEDDYPPKHPRCRCWLNWTPEGWA